VHRAAELYRAQYAESLKHKKLRIEERYCQDGLAFANIDEDELEAAIGHIIDNAIRFSPKGGVIT